MLGRSNKHQWKKRIVALVMLLSMSFSFFAGNIVYAQTNAELTQQLIDLRAQNKPWWSRAIDGIYLATEFVAVNNPALFITLPLLNKFKEQGMIESGNIKSRTAEFIVDWDQSDELRSRDVNAFNMAQRLREKNAALRADGVTAEEQKKIDANKELQAGIAGQVGSDRSSMVDAAQKSLESESSLGNMLGSMLAWLLYYVAIALGWILMLISWVMLKIASYNSFLKESAVQYGWRTVRDICNNFFIILLLITAISTMLRKGDFKDWRGMLPRILIAAVVINFSLLMCGVMIDVSQIFTLTFASPLNSSEGYNVILIAMGLPSSMELKSLNASIDSGGIWVWDLVAALIYAIITTIVTMVVVVCITVVLAFRIVMLWFLVVLSPLPFLLSLFKQGEGYAKQWWTEFNKYLIVGPVLMFFLYLSFMFMTGINSTDFQSEGMNNRGVNGNTSNILGVEAGNMGKAQLSEISLQAETASGTPDSVSLSNAASPNGLINFLMVIGLMVGSLIMAQKMGVQGSKFAGQGLDMLKKQGKRWSGLNLAKSAPKYAKTLGTAIDDRYNIRQTLYSGAFKAGASRIPGVNQNLGKRIGELEAGKQKRNSTYYSSIAKGFKVDDMNEDELRKLAKGGGNKSVVAAQALMKKGFIRDNESDPAKDDENVKIIKEARRALAGTDLGDTFDDNMKKRNPKLALKTAYSDSSGRLDKDKIEEDVKNGKIDFANVLAVANAGNLKDIKELMGGDSAGAMKYLNNIFGGDSKKMSAAIGKIDDEQIIKQLFGKVDASKIKDLAQKDELDASGNVIGKIADHKMLDGILSALVENGVDIGDVGDYYDKGDEKSRKAQASFITKNASNLKDIYEDQVDSGNASVAISRMEKIFDGVGDLLGKDAVDKLKAGGNELKKAVDEAFNLSLETKIKDLDALSTTATNYNEEKAKLENYIERGVVGGAKFNLSSGVGGALNGVSGASLVRTHISNKMGEFGQEELDKMRLSSDPASIRTLMEMLWENSDPTVLLNVFKEGKNNKLKKELRLYVKAKYSGGAPGIGDPNKTKYDLIQQFL